MNYLTGKIDTCDQIDLTVMNNSSIEQQVPGFAVQLSEETMKEERKKFVAYLNEFLQQTKFSITKMYFLELIFLSQF